VPRIIGRRHLERSGPEGTLDAIEADTRCRLHPPLEVDEQFVPPSKASRVAAAGNHVQRLIAMMMVAMIFTRLIHIRLMLVMLVNLMMLVMLMMDMVGQGMRAVFCPRIFRGVWQRRCEILRDIHFFSAVSGTRLIERLGKIAHDHQSQFIRMLISELSKQDKIMKKVIWSVVAEGLR